MGHARRIALLLNPKYPTVNHWYGDYLAAQGRVEESIRYYSRAISYDTLTPVLKLSLGWLLMAQRRFDESIAQFRRAIELDTTLFDVRTHMARSMISQGRRAEAIDSARPGCVV